MLSSSKSSLDLQKEFLSSLKDSLTHDIVQLNVSFNLNVEKQYLQNLFQFPPFQGEYFQSVFERIKRLESSLREFQNYYCLVAKDETGLSFSQLNAQCSSIQNQTVATPHSYPIEGDSPSSRCFYRREPSPPSSIVTSGSSSHLSNADSSLSIPPSIPSLLSSSFTTVIPPSSSSSSVDEDSSMDDSSSSLPILTDFQQYIQAIEYQQKQLEIARQVGHNEQVQRPRLVTTVPPCNNHSSVSSMKSHSSYPVIKKDGVGRAPRQKVLSEIHSSSLPEGKNANSDQNATELNSDTSRVSGGVNHNNHNNPSSQSIDSPHSSFLSSSSTATASSSTSTDSSSLTSSFSSQNLSSSPSLEQKSSNPAHNNNGNCSESNMDSLISSLKPDEELALLKRLMEKLMKKD